MKKLQKLFGKLSVLFLIAGAAILIVLFLTATISRQEASECVSVKIRIDHDKGNFFLDEGDINRILEQEAKVELIGVHPREIDFPRIENMIRDNPFVENAEIYVDIKGNLFIDVVQREPILRVINTKGVSYYIDKNGQKLPVCRKFTARVPVSTGHITDNHSLEGELESPVLKELYALARFISQDKFWKAQIEQIDVNDKHEFELVPRVGDHVIEFGDATGIVGKFDKLMLFYKEGLKSVGWNKYRSINLKYNDQVVCVKK